MKEKSKWGQFICEMLGHGGSNSKVPGGFHTYCPRCGKTLNLEIDETVIKPEDKVWLMKKI